MRKLFYYWIQGWRFQLAMLLFNICFGLILIPIGLISGLERQSYYLIAMFIYVLLIPMGGYLSYLLKAKEFPNELIK